MSKAFTKETDGDDDGREAPEAPALPKGTKNYTTAAGFRRLADELAHLVKVERPKIVEIVSWAAGNGDRSENGDYIFGKRRLAEIDRRTRFLRKRLEIAEVVDPTRQRDRDRVFFGARVTYADSKDQERTIHIVGVDEARIEAGEVSWIAPVARALMRARVGDTVEMRSPAGVERIEVIEISYDTDPGAPARTEPSAPARPKKGRP